MFASSNSDNKLPLASFLRRKTPVFGPRVLSQRRGLSFPFFLAGAVPASISLRFGTFGHTFSHISVSSGTTFPTEYRERRDGMAEKYWQKNKSWKVLACSEKFGCFYAFGIVNLLLLTGWLKKLASCLPQNLWWILFGSGFLLLRRLPFLESSRQPIQLTCWGYCWLRVDWCKTEADHIGCCWGTDCANLTPSLWWRWCTLECPMSAIVRGSGGHNTHPTPPAKIPKWGFLGFSPSWCLEVQTKNRQINR